MFDELSQQIFGSFLDTKNSAYFQIRIDGFSL
ncbi:hypothetical protein M6B38_250895 [Iris pallida]|uniref:Photosystem II protein I n=1 Tax=Iris pallida TaxID=29817 RepID=A0AAX6ILE4_IRIPA|nr:hypothetical protein M6B38_250895 [Iris pallida]